MGDPALERHDPTFHPCVVAAETAPIHQQCRPPPNCSPCPPAPRWSLRGGSRSSTNLLATSGFNAADSTDQAKQSALNGNFLHREEIGEPQTGSPPGRRTKMGKKLRGVVTALALSGHWQRARLACLPKAPGHTKHRGCTTPRVRTIQARVTSSSAANRQRRATRPSLVIATCAARVAVSTKTSTQRAGSLARLPVLVRTRNSCTATLLAARS